MDFESLKEQYSEKLTFYKSQVIESEIYIRLKERYENLTPNLQKAVKYAGVFLLIYFFYSIPASFVNDANEKLGFFEENRQLTRELIRAGRIDKSVKLPSKGPSESSLQSEVDRILTKESVLSTQKMASTAKNNIASKKLVPKSIKQSGVKASIKQLNLRQVIRVGEALNKINSTQLMNMTIQANSKDPHYFAVDYEVASFEVPQDPIPKANSNKKRKSKSRKNRKKKGSK